jgi:P-type Cu2+ transporter
VVQASGEPGTADETRKPDQAVCELCATPLRRDSERYCCSGCARVAEILANSGFTGDARESAAFREALRSGLVPGVTGAVATEAAAETAGDTHQVRLSLTGLWCPSCAWLVESVLARTRGVISSRVIFLADLAEVRFDPTVVGREGIVARIEGLGYGVVSEEEGRRDRGPLLRLGIASFLALNVMMLSYSVHAGRLDVIPESMAPILVWIIAALTAAVVFGAGYPALDRAWRALRARAVTMDTLIALGALSAFCYSLVEVIRGGRDIYFDGASAIIAFWLLGRVLEQAAFRRAAEAGQAVKRLLPRKVRKAEVEGPGHRWVPADEVSPGDEIRVEPGERVPVDARVRRGRGHVRTAVVDGEPLPRAVAEGDAVPGGSVCAETALDLEVTARADDSLLARIADHVGSATGRKEKGPEIADALARLFVPFVIGLSIVTAAAWLAHGLAPDEVFARALTVLVVSCPCALGVAAPLPRVVASGALARRGIIVRAADALEGVAAADCIALDKTGTVTEGRLDLTGVRAEGMTDDEAVGLLAACEERAGHAIAEAARREAAGGELPTVTDLRVVSGRGVEGRLDGRSVRVGWPAWVRDGDEAFPSNVLRFAEEGDARGRTSILLRVEGGPAAAFTFGDRPRAEAKAALARLADLGMETVLLSGDSQAATEAMAREVGVAEARGGCLPVDKAAWLSERRQSSGRGPLFVGDGINDAPALAEAVGIAVATGTDFAREAAEVILLDPGLDSVPVLVTASRRMRRVLRQNLAWAALYNVVGIPAAIFGLLDPVAAAGAMAASGLLVTLNALRLRRIGCDDESERDATA